MSNVIRLPLKWTLRSWLEHRIAVAEDAAERAAFENALRLVEKGKHASAVARLPAWAQDMGILLLAALREEDAEDPAVVTRASVLLDVLEHVTVAFRALPDGSDAKGHLHEAGLLLLDLVGPSVGAPRPHARVRPGFEP